ncbi:MAG: hypothetical protein RBS57_06655 [Desulforhabdus sp.]|nr:hypothetical protein [Desulforhabdus sp.]
MEIRSFSQKFKQGISLGLYKGWFGLLWMLKILIPVSLLTTLLEWSGWIGGLDFIVQPVMGLLSLPAMAALPLIIGMLTGVYGGIAAMVALPFSKEQMTLMAIFLLIAHNLIQEGIIQGQSGLHPLKATVFRLVAAFITVLVVAQFMDTSAVAALSDATKQIELSRPFAVAMKQWATAMLYLSLKILFLIMGIMVLLETLKALGWIDHIVRMLLPFLRTLGLSSKVGMLWMTAVVFGLAYGAAVIVEEAKRGDLSEDELTELQLSIGINHSMVEDPALFLSLGLSAFWLWIPRLLTAIIAVRLLTLWQTLRRGVKAEG